MYKKIKSAHGYRYLKDGKFVKKENIPEEELKKAELAFNPIVVPDNCLFCGVPAKLTRFVNLQTIVLCEEHYYSTTVGNIAKKLREQEDNAFN